ncbi:MAG TPA: hypothetical protein VGR35_01780 [Tepidisphaeraceae bacterium]|nr:hypothetical protein [Tepidisphaeraceae bacterium]
MLSRVGPVLFALLVGSLLATASGGCQNKQEFEEKALREGEINAAAVRERFMGINPNNRVGVVTAVLEDSNLAAVGDIPLQDFGVGDVLVFIDDREQPFNSGTVVNATSNALHVRYQGNERAPRVGELAVRLAR